MNSDKPQTLLEQLASQKQDVLNAHWKCCINCDHWLAEQKLCKLAKQQPPLKIIVTGCELWEDEIPF